MAINDPFVPTPSPNISISGPWTANNQAPAPGWQFFGYITYMIETYAPGATQLNGLTDVTLVSPSDSQALVYNAFSSQWENQDIPRALDELQDTHITSPVTGNTIVYNSTSGKWENGSGFVTLNGVQTVTNKTLTNTTVLDIYSGDFFTMSNVLDPDKKMVFNLDLLQNNFKVDVVFPAPESVNAPLLLVSQFGFQDLENKTIDGSNNVFLNIPSGNLTVPVPITKGGTALSSVGLAGQLLTVNSGANGYIFTDPYSGKPNVAANLAGGSSGTPFPLVTGYNIAEIDNATNEFILPAGVTGDEVTFVNKISPGGGAIFHAPAGGTVDSASSKTLLTLTSVKIVCVTPTVWQTVMYGTV